MSFEDETPCRPQSNADRSEPKQKEVTLIIPSELKVFMEYVSPSIFKVVSLTDAAKKSAKLIAMLAPTQKNQEIIHEAKEHLSARLPKEVRFTTNLSQLENLTEKIDSLSLTNKQSIGESILKLYFEQLKSDQWVFLDLRLNHLHQATDNEKPHLLWEPSPLMHRFSNSFLEGLHQVYEGFYEDHAAKLEGGLIQLGLLDTNSTDYEKQKLIGLLLSHFDKGSEGLVLFDLGDFYQSFHQMFVHLKKQKRRLQTDFVFLGIYLVSLYIGLEKLGVGLDVRSAWNATQIHKK